MSSILKLVYISGDNLTAHLEQISGDPAPAPALCAYNDGEYTASFEVEGVYRALFYDDAGDLRYLGYVELKDGSALNEVVDRERDLLDINVTFDQFINDFTVTVPAVEADQLDNANDAQITRYAGTKWIITVDNMGSHPSKLYFTVKRNDEKDADSLIQAVVSQPADAADGLLVFRGKPAADQAHAAIVVESYDDNGTTKYRATATIEGVATAVPPDLYRFDFKETDTPAVITEAKVKVPAPVTDATS